MQKYHALSFHGWGEFVSQTTKKIYDKNIIRTFGNVHLPELQYSLRMCLCECVRVYFCGDAMLLLHWF